MNVAMAGVEVQHVELSSSSAFILRSNFFFHFFYMSRSAIEGIQLHSHGSVVSSTQLAAFVDIRRRRVTVIQEVRSGDRSLAVADAAKRLNVQSQTLSDLALHCLYRVGLCPSPRLFLCARWQVVGSARTGRWSSRC